MKRRCAYEWNITQLQKEMQPGYYPDEKKEKSMGDNEKQAYTAYQNAKEQLADAVESMKTAATVLDLTEQNIKEDIKDILDEKEIDVDDWII